MSRSPYVLLVFSTFILLLFIGFWGHMVTQKEMQQLLESQLLTTLNADKESIKLWYESKKQFVRSWAQDPEIKNNIIQLIKKAKPLGYNHETLLHSEELISLRQRLGPVVKEYGMVGFVIFDTSGMEVGALLDDPVGQRQLFKRSDFVQRSLNGETVVSVPFKGEILLPDANNVFRKDWPTMFVSTPIKDKSEKIIGVLSFRLRPEQSFTRVLEISRLGETGESFVFNSEGYLLSAPRHIQPFRDRGLIPNDPDSTAILNVQLREGPSSAAPLDMNSAGTISGDFTLMARHALRKEAGVNSKGYPNYFGTYVIGAWIWLDEFNLGLAVEQEVQEAFAPLIVMRSILFGIFVLLGLACSIALVFRINQARMEAKEKDFLKTLKEQEEEKRAIINNAIEAIITLDHEGFIETVNPAADIMFGYQPGQLLKKNIYEIIPKSDSNFLDLDFNSTSKSEKKKVFIRAKELVAVNRNGVRLPIELTLSTMIVGDTLQYIGLIRDITERKRSQEQLEQLHRRNQLILDAAGEGIFGVDLEGLITFINPAGAELLGYAPDEMTGKPQHILMQPLDSDGVPYTLPENPTYMVYRDGQVRHVSQHYFRHRNGESFPVEYTSKPIFEDGNIVGTVVTFRNISQQMESEQNLRQYAQDLEKINKELSNFTSVATHDLQEPLRKVVTLSDRLTMTNNERLDEKGRDYLERIVSSVRRMQQLVIDLLEYSKTTSLKHEFSNVQMNEEIKDVLSTLEIQIEKTQATIEVDPLPELEGSAFQIRQLFQNLISNAIKFHKPGVPPHVTIKSEKRVNGSWTIVVEDEGIGFDEQYLDRIFQPFRRLHRQEEFEGSGMGLAVCEKIVSLHRGMITAESTKNHGSRFIIVLPEKQTNGH